MFRERFSQVESTPGPQVMHSVDKTMDGATISYYCYMHAWQLNEFFTVPIRHASHRSKLAWYALKPDTVRLHVSLQRCGILGITVFTNTLYLF